MRNFGAVSCAVSEFQVASIDGPAGPSYYYNIDCLYNVYSCCEKSSELFAVTDADMEELCLLLLLQQCRYGSAAASAVISSYLRPSSFSSLCVSIGVNFTDIYCSLFVQ